MLVTKGEKENRNKLERRKEDSVQRIPINKAVTTFFLLQAEAFLFSRELHSQSFPRRFSSLYISSFWRQKDKHQKRKKLNKKRERER